jgi:molybdenum cofactor synthesis domain-containing protein
VNVEEHSAVPLRVGIVTISDKASRGERDDRGGPAIQALVVANGWTVAQYVVVPDEADQIAATLQQMADDAQLELVCTTGGTGLAPRDVTPQATRTVLDYEVPGLAEAMRAASLAVTPAAMLSRATAGVRRRTLIVNLPGNPNGARECLETILPALPHAVSTLRTTVGDHQPPGPAIH